MLDLRSFGSKPSMKSRFKSLAAAGLFATASLSTFAADSAAFRPSAALIQVLDQSSDSQLQLDILRGMSEALRGKRNVPMPAGWEQLELKLGDSTNEQVRILAQSLGLTFGSQRALAQLKQVVANSSGDANTRRATLDSLLTTRDPQLPEIQKTALNEPAQRATAIRGLARFDSPDAARTILDLYANLNATEKRDAINTLAARASYAKLLLASAADGHIPRHDLTADVVRQLRNLKVPEINDQVQKVWGSFRE